MKKTMLKWWALPLWHFVFSARFRSFFLQFLCIAGFAFLLYGIAQNVASHLVRLHIASGFGFLDMRAGISIPDALIPYNQDNTYFRALVVGLINSIFISTLSIIVATCAGLLLALGRLSRNGLLRALCLVYVEIFRNIPLLLVVLFCYFGLMQQMLPTVRESISLPFHTYINQRGIYFPWLDFSGFDFPELQNFNIRGGAHVSPEFLALFMALSLYSAALISETIRAGIEGVDKGVKEAASALGLSFKVRVRFIIMPLALRIIIPPLTSQYINIVKNSSLAVAIGYSDLMRVSNSILNQTNQSVEIISILIIVYLTLSLLISIVMNWLNHKILLMDHSRS